MVVQMCITLGELSLIVFYLWMLPVTRCCLFFVACIVCIKALCLLIYLVFTIRQFKIPTATNGPRSCPPLAPITPHSNQQFPTQPTPSWAVSKFENLKNTIVRAGFSKQSRRARKKGTRLRDLAILYKIFRSILRDRPGGILARCGEITMFTHLQLIKAAFVAVLETRSVGSTWPQRERFELRSKSEIYKQELRRMLKKKTMLKRNVW